MENKQEIRLADLADQVISAVDRMKDTYGAFETHPSQQAELSKVRSVLQDLTTRLEDN